jgi:UDP-N-acetyl-D-glucosamine dehydrogenase
MGPIIQNPARRCALPIKELYCESMVFESLLSDKSARIGVMGLGYVGLPLAMEFARQGYRVSGFEVSEARVASLKKGRSYVEDVEGEELRRRMKAGLFAAYSDFSGVSACDVLIICVQTPLRKTKEPDLSNVVAAAEQVGRRLKKGALVILESTTPPGATEEVVRPVLERGGRKLGRDFFLAFSPERVDPGNKFYNIANTPKIVGGVDARSTAMAVELYKRVVAKVVPVSSARAAEMAKLLENSFRSVNIALVNEMAQVCHKLNLDVWEVIGAAATKPFGFMPFYPGPGIGGHCIPKDPQLLIWKMKQHRYEPRFLQLATTVNGDMPGYVVQRIAALLNDAGKALNGSRVFVLGVAYKADTSDFRESPALDVIELLLERGVRVSYHDRFVPQIKLPVAGRALRSQPLTRAALTGADCVLILTAHTGLDYEDVLKRSRRLFDARNALRGRRDRRLQRL